MVAFKYKNGSTWTNLVLPVANGGTGLTSAPSMLTNLESATAVNIFQSAPRPGVVGKLGASNGGTGASSIDEARKNLKVASPFKIVAFKYEVKVHSKSGNSVANINLESYVKDGWLPLCVLGFTSNHALWWFPKIEITATPALNVNLYRSVDNGSVFHPWIKVLFGRAEFLDYSNNLEMEEEYSTSYIQMTDS